MKAEAEFLLRGNEYLENCGIFYRSDWIRYLLFLVLGLNVEKNMRRRKEYLLIPLKQCFEMIEFC